MCASGFSRQALSFFVAAMLAGLPDAVAADTHYVWEQAPNPTSPYTNGWEQAAHDIQPAINSASSGDLVLVNDGLYTNSLNGSMNTSQVVIAKALTLRSVNGAAATIIDGNYPVVTNRCVHATVAGVEVDGFTVRNGFVTNGLTHGFGAGIHMPKVGIVRNCMVSGNRVAAGTDISSSGGAGICMGEGFVGTITGLIDHCWIANNTNSNKGGGFYAYKSNIQNCQIYGNSSGTFGGGGEFYFGTVIRNCVISNNTAGYGGGLSIRGTMENCLVCSNRASNGGGVYLGNGSTTIRNCTIAQNYTAANYTGHGIFFANNALGSLVNVIVALNDPTAWNRPSIHYQGATTSFGWYTNCSVQVRSEVANANSVTNELCLFGVNNRFVNAAASDFRLAKGSVCINAGGAVEPWMYTAVDLDGHTRVDPLSGLVDMGAYEFLSRGTLLSVQ